MKVMQDLMKELDLGLFMIKARSETNNVYSKEVLLYADNGIMSFADTKVDALRKNMEAQKEWKMSTLKEYKNTSQQ